MIYLDNAASTQIDPRVVEVMMPYLTEQYGNPGSLYKLGRDAHAAVEKAREQVARFLGAEPEQIIFTSGATEANNMVFSVCEPLLEKIGRKHIVTSAIEHQSVLKSVQHMATKLGFDVSYSGVNCDFSPFPYDLIREMRADTGLVSIMYANNEIGYTHDVCRIGQMCRERRILFHTDCVQAAGCLPIHVWNIGCDFATISSHKIHGPKGVGALFIKDKSKFEPMIRGGDHQEFGMRGGTENVAGIVGFGKACELAMENLSAAETDRMERMKSAFLKGFSEQLKKSGLSDGIWDLNGCSHYGTKTLNFCVHGIDAESLILMLDNTGVCISAGSACNSRENTPSHVLTAIGLTADRARSSFRVSMSRMNTENEVCDAGKIVAECVATLLKINPDGEG